MVVSTHANERGASVCGRTRVVPGGCAATNERGAIEPSSPAESVPMYRTDGTRANERGPNAHKRIGAVRKKDSCPPGFAPPEATSERDVVGPMPMVISLPNMRGSLKTRRLPIGNGASDTIMYHRENCTNRRKWTLAPRRFDVRATRFPV